MNLKLHLKRSDARIPIPRRGPSPGAVSPSLQSVVCLKGAETTMGTPTYDWQEPNCQAFAYHTSWQTCRLCTRNTRSYSGYTLYLTTNPLTTYNDCELCSVNTYSTDGASCVSCPTNTYSDSIGSTSSTNCECDVGFTDGGSALSCSQCDTGKYKDSIGSAARRSWRRRRPPASAGVGV